MKNVKTSLTTGGIKNIHFGDNLEYRIEMNDNRSFEKDHDCLDEFLKDFYPNTPSVNLLNRIKEEFYKNGKITYKPKGYKANQTFYFSEN